MNFTEYQRVILKARRQSLNISDENISLLIKSFEQSVRRVQALLNGLDNAPNKTAALKIWQDRKRGLEIIGIELKHGLAATIKESQSLAAIQMVQANELAEQSYLMPIGKSSLIATDYSAIPALAVESLWKRVSWDGKTLSKRMQIFEKYTAKRLNAIVVSGISNGMSAVNMAKQIQADVMGIKSLKEIPEELRWTTRIARSATARGSLHYNALMIARTEINNALHEADAMAAAKSKIVLGVKWNLSPRHGKYCVCDQLATQDAYDLGNGVYPPGDVPVIPHPNDMCYTTRVLRPPEQWGKKIDYSKPKTEFEFKHPKVTKFEDATRQKVLEVKVTENYRKRIENQYKSMLKNAVGTLRIKE